METKNLKILIFSLFLISSLSDSGYGQDLIVLKSGFAISYKYYLRTFKSVLQTGLILNKANIREEDGNYLHPGVVKDSATKWGLLIGYAGSLVEKEVFFIRFQTQFRYVFPVKFTNAELFMNNEKIGLSHFFIGFQTGVKIYTDKK